MKYFTEISGIVGFALLTWGSLTQIRRTYRRKTVADISWLDVVTRLAAAFLLLFKFLTIGDPTFTLGQAVLTASLTYYTFLYFRYKRIDKGELK